MSRPRSVSAKGGRGSGLALALPRGSRLAGTGCGKARCVKREAERDAGLAGQEGSEATASRVELGHTEARMMTPTPP
jgi:hypothetical protein